MDDGKTVVLKQMAATHSIKMPFSVVAQLSILRPYMKKNKEVNKHLTTYLESKTNLHIWNSKFLNNAKDLNLGTNVFKFKIFLAWFMLFFKIDENLNIGPLYDFMKKTIWFPSLNYGNWMYF